MLLAETTSGNLRLYSPANEKALRHSFRNDEGQRLARPTRFEHLARDALDAFQHLRRGQRALE
jgi:hypothetical protein